MQEMVQSLGWEDPLEKEMATDSSILAWEIPRTEEPGGLQSMGSQRVRHDWTHTHAQAQNYKFMLHKMWTQVASRIVYLLLNYAWQALGV